MITLLLAVTLSQYTAPPLTAAFDTAEPEPQVGRMGWTIATPILSGIGAALAGRRLVAELAAPHQMFPADNVMQLEVVGLFVGSAVGIVAGWAAGYFARQGSTAAKIASVALMALGGGMICFQAYESVNDVHNWNFSSSLGSW